ncbi:DNA starvation/stationary phase protection protein [Paenibacillus filicis]|uniref:DNA starvation/stationary phase protection protein n=1 Tax=Paenibacillus gyeongsangnamensis TaxID=3388067 RepID=A0ABT4QH93_9BACL|nr:Dps family protein [Paenibacillus filicis]MCZ8516227.1 DNA starvation/stationary phase protection protein [Paenibacillus filicis]
MATKTVKKDLEQTLTELLNRQVANWAVLYIKLHQHHFYVKGPGFYDLHIKFEELYKEADLYFDELAERILTLDGEPLSTMKEYLEATSIQEMQPLASAEEMVKEVIRDFTTVIDEIGETMNAAESRGDDGTCDMLLKIRTALEKHVWMLRSYISK